MAEQLPSGQGPPHYRGFTITKNTPHSVGLLWTSDQPDADTTHTQHSHDVHVPGGIRTHYSSTRAAADARLRPRGHWHRIMNKMA